MAGKRRQSTSTGCGASIWLEPRNRTNRWRVMAYVLALDLELLSGSGRLLNPPFVLRGEGLLSRAPPPCMSCHELCLSSLKISSTLCDRTHYPTAQKCFEIRVPSPISLPLGSGGPPVVLQPPETSCAAAAVVHHHKGVSHCRRESRRLEPREGTHSQRRKGERRGKPHESNSNGPGSERRLVAATTCDFAFSGV